MYLRKDMATEGTPEIPKKILPVDQQCFHMETRKLQDYLQVDRKRLVRMIGENAESLLSTDQTEKAWEII